LVNILVYIQLYQEDQKNNLNWKNNT